MNSTELTGLVEWFEGKGHSSLHNRRLIISELEPVLNTLSSSFEVSQRGQSFESRPIYTIKVGSGGTKILIWTQMHGNESTGTKAVLDLFQWLENPGGQQGLRDDLLSSCTLCIIPMLNPDGAERYTRLDSQGIDLNRDVLEKKAPESRLLQEVLIHFDPDYCFNMHDQRTIFSVGSPPRTATLSFLAPSEDEGRSLTSGRIKTMELIAAIYDSVKNVLEGKVGRYTDEFYPAATGDNFQRMGYSTVLIESGHFPGDYQRQETRKFTFLALLSGLLSVSRGVDSNYRTYFEIPNNEKRYLDGIVKNATIGQEKGDIGVFYKEELVGNEVRFIPSLERFEDLSGFEADKIISGDHLTFPSKEEAKKWLLIEFI